MQHKSLIIRQAGLQSYQTMYAAMHTFTETRTRESCDEFWSVQHYAIYTQGQAGKPEHYLRPNSIPVIQSDRGGQITYHGPGQQIVYVLLDIKRLELSVRTLVSYLENAVIDTLAQLGIEAYSRQDAPGVYVNQAKICSLGLRIRKGYSLHGLALNIDMDLSPFDAINPCGYAGLKMTQVRTLYPQANCADINQSLLKKLSEKFNYSHIEYKNWSPADYDQTR